MSSDDPFLDAAASIGLRIVADAVWHDGRCSWVGAIADPLFPRRAEYGALGPDVYGGTAGIGLFLAELAVVTADPAVRRTAIGALRHAIRRATMPAAAQREGFHRGSFGIAWALADAAGRLGEEELHTGARSVADSARPVSGTCGRPDLLMGSAGTIVGLLALSPTLDDPRLAEAAFRVGEGLVQGATVTRHGWSWAVPGRSRARRLCGCSHGAAGIGWALAELFGASGDDRFREGAAGAFAYERSWLDADTGTWPDLRIGGQRRGAPGQIASPAAGTWSHGEAGIALTRLRATAVLGDGPHARDAEIALGATERHLAEALPFAIDDLSLCNGLTGAADVLMSAAEVGWDCSADLASALARVALERYSATGEDWPCGAMGRKTPGLFLGLAGIGWFFLRLHDRATRSPLAPWDVVDSVMFRT
jgi:lantibiotic modifying enzyme